MKKFNLSSLGKFYGKWCKRKKIKVVSRWLQMTFTRLIIPSSPAQIRLLHRDLYKDSCWSTDFVLCTIASCLIATFGLLSNSAAVIIGAMIVAPLMLPLRGLAFSACEADLKLFRTALLSLTGATILALFLSSVVAKIVAFPDVGSEIVARTQPNLIDLGIALSAGAISGFGKVREGISETLAGTAIAVALMPPLCVVGISLTLNNYPYALGAFLLYITNLLGITLACMFAFILSGYTKANKALGLTTLLTTFLLLPLGLSFTRLLQQQRIQTEITQKLINETITVGKDVENVQIRVLWGGEIPRVRVTLETDKIITPTQVRLVRDYVNSRMSQEFEFVFYIIPLNRVTADDDKQVLPSFDLDKNESDWRIDNNDNIRFPLRNRF